MKFLDLRIALLCLWLGVLLGPTSLRAQETESGAVVAVLYNKNSADSKAVAQHYAKARSVPESNLIGLDLSDQEVISRKEFKNSIEEPLWKIFRDRNLFTVETKGADGEQTRTGTRVSAAKIRYLVLCLGVPLKIKADPELVEFGTSNLQAELKRNEASVDNELALLPQFANHPMLTGPLVNKFYATTNASALHPTNGILLTARLDGPSTAIAKKLVDNAILAEKQGLWGRAYIDARGLTEPGLKQGDDWMLGAARALQRSGFETALDERPETLAAGFPLSQVAFYAGWYDEHVSGPFTLPSVEFMPGAFAYHLHSHNAYSLKTPGKNWVGPFLAKGVTATMGSVEEPYLGGTPDIGTFAARWLAGWSFAEAAHVSQQTASWLTTVIGDPLYRPFSRKPQQLHEELLKNKNPMVEWSHLKVVNLNMVGNYPVSDSVTYLQSPQVPPSAVLQEKLGDLLWQSNQKEEALSAWTKALSLRPSPQQERRLFLRKGRELDGLGRKEEVYQTFSAFLKKHPDYPEAKAVMQRLAQLATELGKTAEAEEWQKKAGAK